MPRIETPALPLLDISFTFSTQTVVPIAMHAHITDRALMYVVMGSAALLAEMAFVGLCTQWLGLPQITLISIALGAAIELSLVWGARALRG